MRLSRNVVALFLTIFFVLITLASKVAFAADVQISPIKEVQKLEDGNTAAVQGKLNAYNTGNIFFNASAASFYCTMMSCKVGVDGAPVSGAYGTMVAYVGKIYETKPASTETYVADVLRQMNISVAQPAYAQGLGFGALEPILTIWKAFRNLAYLGFVLIFIIIGFMIMFRQKIGSQSVVTVQQALPNIVISLITVTFSYAIASLMIDLMYLSMAAMVTLFSTQVRIDGFPYLSGSIIDLASFMLTLGGNGISDVIGSFVTTTWGNNDPITKVLASAGGGFATLSAQIIFALVIVFQLFKLLLALLRTYVDIILQIAFAPIILMMGALPGSKAFGEWLRNLVGNLAVFPAILLLLIVYSVIKTNTGQAMGPEIVPQAHAAGFMPPYMVGGGETASAFLPFLVGLGLLMGMAEVPDAVKKAFGVKGGGMLQSIVEGGWKSFGKRASTGVGIASVVPGAIAGSTIGATAGFVGAKGNLRQRMSKAGQGAVYGAGFGGAIAPIVASGLPVKFGINAGKSAWRQAGDVAVQATIGRTMARHQAHEAEIKNQEETRRAQDQNVARDTQLTNIQRNPNIASQTPAREINLETGQLTDD